MFTNHSRFKLFVLVLTSFVGALTVSAAQVATHDGATRTAGPKAFIQGSELDDATKATVLQLIDEAAASTGQREQFIGSTEAIAQALVDSGESAGFLEDFARSFSNAFQALTKFEWEIKPSVGKCNANFECSLALGVCVVITWSDGNGSGGINCISQSAN